MSFTQSITVEEPKYEYFFQDNSWNNKREILTGARAVKTFNEIPQVDVRRIFSENFEDRAAVAREVSEICKNVGFMYIKNHGVSQDLVDDVFELSKKYYARPLKDKMKQYVYESPSLRGYDVHYIEAPTGPEIRKESFLYSYDCEVDPNPPNLTPEKRALGLGEHNQWPEDWPDFKQKLLEYQAQVLTLARALMRTFALGLGAEETYFDEIITAPFASIILQHYPPQRLDGKESMSLHAHSDFETFTILNQDMVGGLEVLNKNGFWIPAPPVRGTFVVNVGDFLQRISNDTFISTIHRVRNLSGQLRYSIPFFFSFNMDAEVAVLPSCQSAENPAKYGPRNLNEYTAKRRAIQRKQHEAKGLDTEAAAYVEAEATEAVL